MLVSSMGTSDGKPTTELDSHANMVVVGEQAFVFNRSGQHATVNAFSDEAGGMNEVPIVDAVIAYDCQLTGGTYLLVVRNALHVPSMGHNLIPPFIMREAGLVVNDTPKIHLEEPCGDDHTIQDSESGLKIQLKLDGIFSVFDTRALSTKEVNGVEHYPRIFLTPDSPTWDPYDSSYADHEASFLDSRGNMVFPRQPSNHQLIAEPDVSSVETEGPYDAMVDAVIASSVIGMDSMAKQPGRTLEERIMSDPIQAQICSMSGVLDGETLSEMLNQRISEAKFSSAIGSTTADLVAEECELFEAYNPQDGCSDGSDEAEVGAARAARYGVSPEMLQKIWRIDYDTAKRTVNTTTQLNRQDANSRMSRNFGTNDRMLRYRRIKSHFFTDTFFVTKKGTSARGYTCMQIFVSDKGYVFVVPMKSVKEFPKALKLFAKEVGVPELIIADSHRSQKSKEVRDFCHQVGTTLRILEGSTQWANRAELYVGLMKESIRKDMRDQNSPLIFWDYCAERRALITNMTAKNMFQLQGQTPHFATFGEQGDISNICQFGWYEWVYFRDTSASFPYPAEVLGRCLGPAKNEGNEMAQWVLKMNGQVVPRRTLRKLRADELAMETEKSKRAEFDAAIKLKYGDSLSPPRETSPNPQDGGDEASLPFGEVGPQVPEADVLDATGAPLHPTSVADTLLNAEVLLPQGEDMRLAKVIRRSVGENGRVVGHHSDNPILNTILYDVEFPDGAVKPYSANIIAENILGQVDEQGYHTQLLAGITAHSKDETAVAAKDKYFTTKMGRRTLRQTTIGWKFEVLWKDGTKSWVPLKVLKESNPVEVAEYVSSRKLAGEAAFAWWVPYTLRKRDRIISAVNSRVRKANQKYGIAIPNSVEDAIRMDKGNGNSFWQDAINKEMRNVGVAFKILEEGERPPPGYKKASGHLVYDVKMDFTRKARWVKDGHLTPDPDSSSYAGVVSRESIRILLTHAAMMGVEVCAADIRNAYL